MIEFRSLLLCAAPLASSCAFAPGGDADAGRDDARVRVDASGAPSADASQRPDATPTFDATPTPPDASDVDATPIVETLVISEIVDATLPGGLPKFVELTNLGAVSVDLSAYSLGIYSNASATLNGGASHPLNGSLAAGASFVVSFENSDAPGSGIFRAVYGQDPDDFSFGALINGNDPIVLFRGTASGNGNDAVKVDSYGVIGTDGTGEVWDYTDGFATRRQAATTPKAVFDPADWGFSGPDALEGASAAEIVAATSPGSH